MEGLSLLHMALRQLRPPYRSWGRRGRGAFTQAAPQGRPRDGARMHALMHAERTAGRLGQAASAESAAPVGLSLWPVLRGSSASSPNVPSQRDGQKEASQLFDQASLVP